MSRRSEQYPGLCLSFILENPFEIAYRQGIEGKQVFRETLWCLPWKQRS